MATRSLDSSNPGAALNPSLRMHRVLMAGWAVTGVACVLLALSSLQSFPMLSQLLAKLEYHVAADKALYSPLAYFTLLSLVFILERRIPARDQAIFSPGLFLDAMWYFATIVFRVAFLGVYIKLLHSIYHDHLSFLTITAIADWSDISRFLLAAIVIDFLRWLGHLIRHKVSFFWEFHAIHHSQQQLNLFTDARVHPVDRLVSSTLRFVPMLMLGNDVPVILAWAIFETIYPKFYHANVKLNFGPLRYVLVTPQSHRTHHAVAPEHQDKNFGFIFCIWDRLFGTHSSDDFCYPETGVADMDYPHESCSNPLSLAKVFFLQLVYPFQKLLSLSRSKVINSE